MNLSSVSKIGTRLFGRSLLITKKYSPEILTGIGIAGVITASVMASRATLKVEPVIERIRGDVKVIHDVYDENDDKVKDLATVYVRGSLDVIKLYAPSVTLGAASLVSIVAAHGIMRRRNVALVAAYKAIEQGFSEYRKKVVDQLGEDADRDFRFVKEEVIEDEKTGKEKTVKYVDKNSHSIYAKFFDEYSTEWQREAEYNMAFLKCQQNYMNDLLLSRGHVFLNEVYDALGLPRTKAGAVVGWVLDKNNSYEGIDFGIYDFTSDKARQFVNGLEKSILLDFNVDGVVYDKLGD